MDARLAEMEDATSFSLFSSSYAVVVAATAGVLNIMAAETAAAAALTGSGF